MATEYEYEAGGRSGIAGYSSGGGYTSGGYTSGGGYGSSGAPRGGGGGYSSASDGSLKRGPVKARAPLLLRRLAGGC